MKKTAFFYVILMAGLVFGIGLTQAVFAEYQINVEFVSDTSSGPNTVTVLLTLSGPSSIQIAGYHFKVIYDSNQLYLSDVNDNTGQQGSKVAYDIGPETKVNKSSDTFVFRRVLMTTIFNLSMPGNLGKLTFIKKPGYSASSIVSIKDGGPDDGLIDSNYKNIPHNFPNVSIDNLKSK